MFPSASCSLFLCPGEAVLRSQSCLCPGTEQAAPELCQAGGAVGVQPGRGSMAFGIAAVPVCPQDPPGSARGRFSHEKSVQRIPSNGAGRNSPARSPRSENTHWPGHKGSSRQQCPCPGSLQLPGLGSGTIWEKLWDKTSPRPARAPLPPCCHL